MNTISTIVRRREDVKIYMLGNTVNKYSPYFSEMGLTNVLKMEQGSIDVYRYGNSKLTVAVEYCASETSNETTNKYFAFNNPKLSMITGGAWELDIYPHLPYKYKPKDVLLTYYIDFNGSIFQCVVVDLDGVYFTYVHAKTTDISKPNESLIYSLDPKPELNYSANIFRPINKVQERVLWFYINNRVYYQNNEIGDAVSNFLKICKRR